MSYPTPERSHFNSLIEKLRWKLKNFSVVNLQGDRIGVVKDLLVDRQRQLQIIISPIASDSTQPLQLYSKQIKKIEIADKTVVVDFQPASNIERAEENTALESSMSESSLDRHETARDRSEVLNASVSQVIQSESLAPTIMTNEARDSIELHSNLEPDFPVEEIIKLLEERVVVDRKKRKIGEVIVRKEVETRMVEVPVRYEKLIVEQINPERKQIAEIQLGQETLGELESKTSGAVNGIQHNGAGLTVSGRFDSPKIASLLLNAIARERQHGCEQIHIQIVVDNPEKQKTYQEWFDRCSQ